MTKLTFDSANEAEPLTQASIESLLGHIANARHNTRRAFTLPPSLYRVLMASTRQQPR